MSKNVWVQPQTVVQQFVANEYVAACGDLNKVYKFKCDAGKGEGLWGIDLAGDVYRETNGTPGLQTGRGGDRYRSSYHPCGTTHEAKTTDTFLQGYFDPYTRDAYEVIVWRGPNDDNTHCTKNLDMDSWPTDKS